MYTINYRDIVTDKICSSVVIPVSLCEEGSCSHTFEISTSLCPPFTVINVTVFATNALGNGPTSIPKIIGEFGYISAVCSFILSVNY